MGTHLFTERGRWRNDFDLATEAQRFLGRFQIMR
jgi:hypothetical protein